MFNKFLITYLLAHILGDYYFQTEKTAREKEKNLRAVIKHSFIYAIAMLVITVPFWDAKVFVAALLLSLSHAVIDVIKFIIQKRKERDDATVFLVDQALHIACIILASALLNNLTGDIVLFDFVYKIFSTMNLRVYDTARWCLALFFVGKPCGILIQKLLGQFKPVVEKKNPDNQEKTLITIQKSNQSQEKTIVEVQKEHTLAESSAEEVQNAGKTIGYLERIIILILIAIQQYSAIGLVLTAKSIARYDQISKDKAFGEYYLLGTLLSLGTVICAGIVFLKYLA